MGREGARRGKAGRDGAGWGVVVSGRMECGRVGWAAVGCGWDG